MERERRPSDYMEIFLEPGEFQFTTDPDIRFRTLLGSCVALTMWHPKRRCGAMCHYLLPTRGKTDKTLLDGRYGDEAYLMFLNECARHYTNPAHYEIKLFGGGDMFPSIDKAKGMSIGQKNVSAGLALLEHFGLPLKAQHVGGTGHRVIMLDVWDGSVWVKHQTTVQSPADQRRGKKKGDARMKPVNVFVIDDSAVVRQVVSDLITCAPGLNLLGVAPDPLYALEKMQKAWPDVIVLDVEMPRMDGITFLKKIMSEHPTPVVICSTLTEKGTATSLQALAAGAVDIVTKPKVGLKRHLEDNGHDLVDAIKGASHARVARRRDVAPAAMQANPKLSADAVLAAPSAHAMAETTETVVVIGTSTGGTQALEAVLTALPRTAPGIVIVQHMPEKFTAAFAARLNSQCTIEVLEAQGNERVIPGRALIAPGGRHMLLKRSGAYYHVDVVDGPLVSRHRPSVDVLFRSAAKVAGRNALGVIMTGMGDDGAAGLKEMRDAGAHTLAQDEASCVVYGMPKEAVKRGAVERSVPLKQIADEICRRH